MVAYVMTREVALFLAPIVVLYVTAIIAYIKMIIIDLYMAVVGMDALIHNVQIRLGQTPTIWFGWG